MELALGLLLIYFFSVGVPALYLVCGEQVKLFLKIKHLQMTTWWHLRLLKKYPDKKEVKEVESRLENLFYIYTHKISPSIVLVRLFPESKTATQIKLSEYELKMKEKLGYYYKIYQNIGRYNEKEYPCMTLTELVKRI